MGEKNGPIVPYDPEALGLRLSHAAELLGLPPPEAPELDHLVGVVTRCSALLGDVYTDARLRAILADEPRRLARLAAAPWFRPLAGGSASSGVLRLSRLPDEVRGVGDKALFDVALTGRSAVRGVSLEDLGPRAYRLAAEVLEVLADDARLREHFLSGAPGRPGPIRTLEEEVSFLRRCAERFDVYSRLLRHAGDDVPHDSVPPTFLTRALPAPAPSAAAPLPVPLRRPAPRLVERGLGRDQLLTAYERLLLFAGLDLEELRAELAAEVVDQPEAVATLIDDFALYAVGTQNLARPASYFLVGPTGVGKNYLVERLAAALSRRWETEVPLLTIEGPNYTYPSDINELRGATRGFVRSEEPGLLTSFHERAAAAPLSVILIDEVEKAHPQLIRFFLSILDRGTTTDAHGNELSFAGSLIFFTSNIGHEAASQGTSRPIGFGGEEEAEAAYRAELSHSLKRALPPEFINRVKLVRFRHLPRSSAERIVELEFGKIAARYRELHGVELALTAAGREALLARGYSHEYGARHLAAVLQRTCNVEIGRMLRRDEAQPHGVARALIERLREARGTEGPVDLSALEHEVHEAARARVGYARILVDAEQGEIVYRREEGLP